MPQEQDAVQQKQIRANVPHRHTAGPEHKEAKQDMVHTRRCGSIFVVGA